MTDEKIAKIVEYYDKRVEKYGASSGATLLDSNMRLLETQCAASWLSSEDAVLDVFCGNGITTVELARHCRSITGIDLSTKMIETAKGYVESRKPRLDNVSFANLNILDIQKVFAPESFDAVTSIRGLINLPSWELQKQAISSIGELLPKGGKFVFLEGSKNGLDRINELRDQFRLPRLEEPWYDKHFDEEALLELLSERFDVVETRNLDTYFLLSRVLYPLAVLPDEPKFEHVCNTVARFAVDHLHTDQKVSLLICLCLKKR